MTIRNMLQNLRIRISAAARAFGQPTPKVFVVVDNWADELVSVHVPNGRPRGLRHHRVASPAMSAAEPSDLCRCGHTRDEHPAGPCVAVLAVHERTEFCRCGAFELDEVSIAAATA